MPIKLKRLLINLHWFFANQLGFDLLRFFCSLRGLPAFINAWWQFRKKYTKKIVLKPCLHDRYEESGTVKNEYFWQDLLVARWIFEANPKRHVDIGSRVDGFIAHVASFREIEVLDVRPITAQVPGIIFKQADLINTTLLPVEPGGYCDSLSCLHALEHFGLGRYGDSIDPFGYKKGIANMAALLKPGGIFYLSVPIGQERVEFNANWVFDPRTILRCAESCNLTLQKLTVFHPVTGVRDIISSDDIAFEELMQSHYHLGIFILIKQFQINK